MTTQKMKQKNTRFNSSIAETDADADQKLKSSNAPSALRRHDISPASCSRVVAPAYPHPRSKPSSLRATGLALMLATAVCTGNVAAQTSQWRLGNPEVLSSLGSPLWVKIPFTIESAQPGEDLSAARFSLGARPINAPVPFVDRAELTVEQVGNKYALVIRSRNSIDEPAVGIVLRESLPNGVRSREFFLLLDPAPLTVVPIAEATRAAVASEAAPPSQPAGVSPAVVDGRAPSGAVRSPSAPAARARVRKPRRTDSGERTATARTAAVPSGLTSILPAAKGRTLPERNMAEPAPAQGGPRLRLSFGEGLTTRPATTEAERAELRLRQFTLDMDDLTSGLLERQHKITQLEKELASLSLRVSNAERLIGAVAPVAPAPTAAPGVAVTPAVETPPPPTADSAVAVTRTPVPAPAIARKSSDRIVQPTPTSLWTWLLVGAALLAAFATLAWGIRHMLRRRDRQFRLSSQGAEDYVAEVMSQRSAAKPTVADRPVGMAGSSIPKPTATATPAASKTLDFSAQEIHFELPELPPSVDAIIAPPVSEATAKVVTNVMRKPVDDGTSRRMRYLQSRYQDIAILMPPLDAPQRLLRQAATVYDEGATDFSKRLLKFAAYSRPYTEEFWLALLELLYREKFISDYLVNAKWFRQYHPESLNWDEVVRIGYLLDAREPLFAVAAHWSHDEPSPGIWLPANPDEKKPVTSPAHLKLEFTK